MGNGLRPFQYAPVRCGGGLLTLLPVLVLLMLLPLAGIALTGRSLSPYLHFPPLTRDVAHAGSSPLVWIILATALLMFLFPLLRQVMTAQRHLPPSAPPAGVFPWWGWVGLAGGLVAWVLAWTRCPWFRPWQPFTFSPLWLAYILVVNALCLRRTGRCLLSDRPATLAALAVLSAAFWWFFEYLNRFVQNWFYVGIESLSSWQYFLFATLPFATVLPAVVGTSELLDSFPRIGAGLDDFVRLRVARPRIVASMVLVLAAFGLAGIGLWPDILFPLLWVSPLLILISLQTLRGQPTIFSPIAQGRWRRLWLSAIAALICGLFWEMWNFYSQAKWIYSVPYVHRFLIFEMPLLGYAGYLPFGLECMAVADLLSPRFHSPTISSDKNT